MKTLLEVTHISVSCYNQSQSWIFERIVGVSQHPGHKLWVKIERNAYDNQSWARVKRWSGSKWELVYEEPICLCECKSINYAQKGIDIKYFMTDFKRLLDITLKIIQ